MAFLERLNSIASVNNIKANLLLKKEKIIATIADPTGNNICIFAWAFSVLVNGMFSIVSDFITYFLILYKDIPIKIMFKAKNIIAVS